MDADYIGSDDTTGLRGTIRSVDHARALAVRARYMAVLRYLFNDDPDLDGMDPAYSNEKKVAHSSIHGIIQRGEQGVIWTRSHDPIGPSR
jgi:hypothetical protein